MKPIALLLVMLSLAGCGARDCALDIAHRDCLPPGSVLARFPQDDAICRSYGLTPGTHDYAKCRRAKSRVRDVTLDETDDRFLRNPILPDLR